jgi:hypothetical protein
MPAAPSANKLATAFAADDIAATLNAGTVATDLSATLPTVNTLYFGGRVAASNLNYPLTALMHLPRRMSDAELQTLTGA